MAIDLTGDITAAINGAYEDNRPLVIAYVDDEGFPTMSFRGSIHVHSATELAMWSRTTTGGLIDSIAERPPVSVHFRDAERDGVRTLWIRGTARVAPEAADEVYAAMPQGERDHDPDRNGVPIVISVTGVRGWGPAGSVDQSA